MARVQHRKSVPFKIGGVRTDPPDKDATCSKCDRPASKKFWSIYRTSHACLTEDCREREFAWVGNIPWSPNKPKMSPRRRPPPEQPERPSLDVRTPSGRAALSRMRFAGDAKTLRDMPTKMMPKKLSEMPGKTWRPAPKRAG